MELDRKCQTNFVYISFFSDAVVSFVMDTYVVGEEAGSVSICVDSDVMGGFQVEFVVTLSAMNGKACKYLYIVYMCTYLMCKGIIDPYTPHTNIVVVYYTTEGFGFLYIAWSTVATLYTTLLAQIVYIITI